MSFTYYDNIPKMLNLYRGNTTLLSGFGGFSFGSSDIAWASDEAVSHKRKPVMNQTNHAS